MSSYASLSLDRVQPLLTKGQVTAATGLYTEQQTELPDDAATVAKQNYDVVTISEEGKAVAQALNATPVAGASSEDLFLDAVGEPFEPGEIPDGNDYAAQEAFENADGEMIAGYSDTRGGWIDIPTADETRFQYESAQIYRAAYNEAKAEMAAAQQTATPAASGDASASFDVKA